MLPSLEQDRIIRDLSARMSLRLPQEQSLRVLADALAVIEPARDENGDNALKAIAARFPEVQAFERDFPSLCFALATGVGKTRLMGAFMAFLYLSGYSRNFFILTPNTTIYSKIVNDLTLGTTKYVFKGVTELASNPPVIVTGETWDQSSMMIDAAQRDGSLVINIFNIDKINKDVGRIRKLNEYIGESYFDHLASQSDLVLLMDEAHRYRAKAAFKAISDLQPILGLELTATPKTVGARPIDFKNVIYRFGLREALDHGYVKDPAVATRKDIRPKEYSEDELERIKLEDAIHAHTQVKVELEIYHRDTGERLIHPFILVVAQDTGHAQRIKEHVESETFFEGYYRDKVIRIDSATKGEETEEATQRLLALEADNKTEILIHVNKLKEGWDVTNLFTIVPLRASASDILTEQTLGRGLRLPYGRRTGVEAIDRLTIVAHDRFDEVIKAAKQPDSLIQMKTVYIGPDGEVPSENLTIVEAKSNVEATIFADTIAGVTDQAFTAPAEKEAAKAALHIIGSIGRKLRSASELYSPEIQSQIEAQVLVATARSQPSLPGIADASVNVAAIVAKVIQGVVNGTIEIPEIVIVPESSASFTFSDFNLEGLSALAVKPIKNEIVVQSLDTDIQSTITVGTEDLKHERLEDYIVSELVLVPEVDYEMHSDLLYKLAGQVVERLRSYLANDVEVARALIDHRKVIADFVVDQMMQHYVDTTTSFRVEVRTGFQGLKSQNFSLPKGQSARDFRTAVNPKSDTRKHVFNGFKKCCYLLQMFDSDPERELAVIIDRDSDVVRWVKPSRSQFGIWYRRGERYEPDFVVETLKEKLVCEVKARNQLSSTDVVEKARAARMWVARANKHAEKMAGKKWRYLMIPDDALNASSTLDGLISTFEQAPIEEEAGVTVCA